MLHGMHRFLLYSWSKVIIRDFKPRANVFDGPAKRLLIGDGLLNLNGCHSSQHTKDRSGNSVCHIRTYLALLYAK